MLGFGFLCFLFHFAALLGMPIVRLSPHFAFDGSVMFRWLVIWAPFRYLGRVATGRV